MHILGQDNHAGIPGFETIEVVGREDQLIQRVARKQLTKHLGRLIDQSDMKEL